MPGRHLEDLTLNLTWHKAEVRPACWWTKYSLYLKRRTGWVRLSHLHEAGDTKMKLRYCCSCKAARGTEGTVHHTECSKPLCCRILLIWCLAWWICECCVSPTGSSPLLKLLYTLQESVQEGGTYRGTGASRFLRVRGLSVLRSWDYQPSSQINKNPQLLQVWLYNGNWEGVG